MPSARPASHGYKVTAAGSAAKALALARERGGAIDPLITDLIMPGMNGRDMAAIMRKPATLGFRRTIE